MSAEDYFDPYCDPDDYDYGGEQSSRAPVSCNRCGHSPLIWSEVRIGVFRLYDQKLGRLHTCPPALDFK